MKVPDDLDFNSQDSLKKTLPIRLQQQKTLLYRYYLQGCAGSGKIVSFNKQNVIYALKIDHTCEEVRVQAKIEADHIARLIISHARNVRRRKTSAPFTYNY